MRTLGVRKGASIEIGPLRETESAGCTAKSAGCTASTHSSSTRTPPASIVAVGIFDDDPDAFPDDEFDFGLQRILAGIEVLHRSRVSA